MIGIYEFDNNLQFQDWQTRVGATMNIKSVQVVTKPFPISPGERPYFIVVIAEHMPCQ
jgi:hypothetical protein